MIEMIPIGKLWQHKDNPRKDLGDLVELTQSIKQSGIMQNLTVVEMTPEEQVATMLAENMQRVDLTPFEQAQGLQLMFDFGESIESASQKTGLSVSTVRRRKKLLDFNADVLKAAVEQGATLTDLAQLEKLEDLEAKNRCLEKFGESDFQWRLNSELRKQKEKKAMEEWQRFLADSEAEYVEEGFDDLVMIASVYASSFEPSIDRYTERPLFFSFGVNTNYINFYRRRCEADDVKDEVSEERERQAEERQKKMDRIRELTIIAAATRRDFVKNVTEKQCAGILNEIALGFIKENFHGIRSDCFELRDHLEDICGLVVSTSNLYQFATTDPVERNENDIYFENLSLIMKKEPSRYLFCILISIMDPYDEGGYFNKYTNRPIYNPFPALDEVYRLLCLLGYEMTEDEKALQDGSHKLFED